MIVSDIVRSQRKWLDKLQEHSKKPILIKSLEGKIPGELKNSNASSLYCWTYYKDVFSLIQTPYFTRSILVNEIVFDPDTQIWDDLKQEMDKVILTLTNNNIPYLLAYSGGKGCHLHIFFDTKVDIPSEIFDKAKEVNYDLYKAFRQHIFEFIIKESNANIDLLKIDKPKINWQIYNMGSQVRDFGTMRNGGFCKTLIDEIPRNRPLAPLPLIFPDKIEIWKIPDDHVKEIVNKIKVGIVKQTRYNKQVLPIQLGIRNVEDLPCVSNIMNGLDAGRYYGAGAIALSGKEIGLKWDDVEPQVELFLTRCKGLSGSDVILRIENSKHLFDSDKQFSCKWVKENLKCIRPSECIVTIKRNEMREKIADDNDYLKIADSVFSGNNFVTISETDEILRYSDGVYGKNGEVFIKTESQRINDEITTHEVNEIVNYVKRKSYTDIKDLNNYKNLIAMDGGYYNVDNHKLEPYDPNKLLTIRVPIRFNPKAQCPNVDKFLKDILHPEDIPAIEEFFGYCLLREYKIQKAFMLVGEGGNGKSTLINLLKCFLGGDNVCSVALQELEDNHFAAANLFGKLANVYADLPPNALQSTGKIKMLTGNDHITAERKFGGFFDYVNYAKMIFSTNKLPLSFDDTDAFYRRWVILNFPNKFDETKGKGLFEKITTQEELSGMFNRAVIGLKRLLDNGRFSGQKTTEQVREQYIRLSDSVQAFTMDCIEQSADGWIEKKELYRVYGAYCKSKNIPISSEKRFFSRIGFSVRVEECKLTNSERKRVNAFKGIVFKIDINSVYLEENIEDTMSTMSTISPISIVGSILNNSRDKVDGWCERNGANLGHSGQPDQKPPNTLTELVKEKSVVFQSMKSQNINSSNIVEFSMWFCKETGNSLPDEIKRITEKMFAITPEQTKKESHISFLCKESRCRDCGGHGCDCECHKAK